MLLYYFLLAKFVRALDSRKEKKWNDPMSLLHTKQKYAFHKNIKGIVSRDFGGLQMILINRLCVPDVPLEVYSFLNFRFHIVI